MKEVSDSRFVTRKWSIINDQSNTNYDIGNEITRNTEVLKSNLCVYNDAYILVKGDIITIAFNNRTAIAFKNRAPFVKCITKINGTVRIILTQQVVYDFILKTKYLLVMLTLRPIKLLNLSNIRLNY